MTHIVNNVEALWPRINRTYKFDSMERKSVPCDAKDPAASYELSFKLDATQAKDLWNAMLSAYTESKQSDWPAQPNNPFKKDEDSGKYIAKAKLRGNYNGDPTAPPKQYDAKGNKLDAEFMLTTGSTINVQVQFVPYNMREAGVSLRLRAVQVVKYVEMAEDNPFSAVDGFTSEEANPFGAAPAAKADDPFGLPPVAEKPKEAPKASVDFDDEIPF